MYTQAQMLKLSENRLQWQRLNNGYNLVALGSYVGVSGHIIPAALTSILIERFRRLIEPGENILWVDGSIKACDTSLEHSLTGDTEWAEAKATNLIKRIHGIKKAKLLEIVACGDRLMYFDSDQLPKGWYERPLSCLPHRLLIVHPNTTHVVVMEYRCKDETVDRLLKQ